MQGPGEQIEGLAGEQAGAPQPSGLRGDALAGQARQALVELLLAHLPDNVAELGVAHLVRDHPGELVLGVDVAQQALVDGDLATRKRPGVDRVVVHHGDLPGRFRVAVIERGGVLAVGGNQLQKGAEDIDRLHRIVAGGCEHRQDVLVGLVLGGLGVA